MNSEEKKKIAKGFERGVDVGNGVFGDMPLPILLLGSFIFGLVGGCLMFFTRFIKMLLKRIN